MRLIADKSEIDNKLLDTINAFAWDGIGGFGKFRVL